MTVNDLEIPPNATIRQEYVKCGNPDCENQHGPYFYAYWKQNKKLNKRYVGKNFEAFRLRQTAKEIKLKPSLLIKFKFIEQQNETVGASKSVPWPTGIGAPGNEGVANAVKGSPNTIGYLELNYALTKGIPFGLIKNPTGNFIEPSLNSTQEAVSNAVDLNSLPEGDKSWTKVSILKAPGPKSYPIASFSYLVLYENMSANANMDQTKAKALVDFISWMLPMDKS
ncbi:MAG: substrate-binding domain-containing protein [Candidatus Nitrosopolaris sp.]